MTYAQETLCEVIMWFYVFISRKLTVRLAAARLVLRGTAYIVRPWVLPSLGFRFPVTRAKCREETKSFCSTAV